MTAVLDQVKNVAYVSVGVNVLVTDAIVGFRDAYNGPDQPLQEKIDALRKFSDNVIAKV